jgi:redox-sensitive bicupin YhaK (pirin superfamily)
MKKSVKYVIPAFDVNMGGLYIKQALPTNNVNQVDPFLLLHHADFTFNKDSPAIHQGVGPHPHRGFSPVTFVINGELHHRDSRGNNQIAKTGEVQWMNAGAGIIHSERPSKELIKKQESQEIIQLWINSPSSKKMTPPSYQYLSHEDMPKFGSADKLVNNKLIAGEYNNLKSKTKADSELIIIWAEAKESGFVQYNIDQSFNSMLYLIKGNLSVTGFGLVEEKSLVVFENDGQDIEVKSNSDAQYLLLAGKPLNEKLVQQGPFVMNTETEILEAMRDYQMGKMGILIEE